MSKIITLEDMNKDLFYKIPKAFLHNYKYMFMMNETKLAYSIVRDLLQLSIKNGWVNEKNEPFVRISREKLMLRLQIRGKEKITKVMKELVENELIVEERLGQGNTNIIYVCIPDELQNVVYDDEELLAVITDNELLKIGISQKFENRNSGETVDSQLKFEKKTSRSKKIEQLKVLVSNSKKYQNRTVKETNANYNNINDNKQQEQQEVKKVKKEVAVAVVDKLLSNCINSYFDNFGLKPNPAQIKRMKIWIESLDEYDVMYAIEVAASKGKGFDYSMGVLRNMFIESRKKEE